MPLKDSRKTQEFVQGHATCLQWLLLGAWAWDHGGWKGTEHTFYMGTSGDILPACRLACPSLFFQGQGSLARRKTVLRYDSWYLLCPIAILRYKNITHPIYVPKEKLVSPSLIHWDEWPNPPMIQVVWAKILAGHPLKGHTKGNSQVIAITYRVFTFMTWRIYQKIENMTWHQICSVYNEKLKL